MSLHRECTHERAKVRVVLCMKVCTVLRAGMCARRLASMQVVQGGGVLEERKRSGQQVWKSGKWVAVGSGAFRLSMLPTTWPLLSRSGSHAGCCEQTLGLLLTSRGSEMAGSVWHSANTCRVGDRVRIGGADSEIRSTKGSPRAMPPVCRTTRCVVHPTCKRQSPC